MMPNIQIDEGLKALIPPLAPEERAQLEENLLAEGCRDPLVLWGEILIDGHNRHEICRRQGIAFQTVQRDFPDLAAVRIWIAKNQLGRRNLSDFARVELALLVKSDVAEAAANRRNPPDDGISHSVRQNSDERGRTDDTLANMAGVSRDTVRKVEKIKAAAAPEVVEKARSGEISINAASKTISPQPKQSESTTANPRRAESQRSAAKAHADDEVENELEEIQEQVRLLIERNEQLEAENKTLLMATDAEVLTKIKHLQQRINAVESQRNDYQNKCNELTKEVRRLQRQLEKAEKARA